MSNFKKSIAAMLCLFLLWLFLGSCNENSTKPEESPPLAGAWKLTKMISEYKGETETLTEAQLDSMGLVWTLKIEDDGTIEQITNISGPLLTMPGAWETSNNKLTLNLIGPTGETGTLVYEYAIDGNILKLNWELPSGTKFNAEFTKQ